MNNNSGESNIKTNSSSIKNKFYEVDEAVKKNYVILEKIGINF